MSALSFSPSTSPAASPHSAHHTSSPRRNPRRSPRIPASSPSRRAIHAPVPSSPRQARRVYQGSNEREAPVRDPAVRYIDTGTQYSPECYPPTAGKVAVVEGKPSGGEGSAKKRKDAARPDPPSDPMSGVSASGAATQEPDPWTNPAPTEDVPVPKHFAQENLIDPPFDPSLQVQEARSTHGHSAAPKKSRPDPTTEKQMPLQYELCNPKDLGALISNMLLELIRINDHIPIRDGRLTRFHSRAPPGISVSDYLQRLIQHATLSPPILLSMVYYIDRLCTMYTNFTINSLTVHRFLITAATVAAKGLSDSFWTNPTYARIGGIPVTELATLELELLQRVDWKIVPKPEILVEYYSSLVDRTEGYALESVQSSELSDTSSIDDDSKMSDGPS